MEVVKFTVGGETFKVGDTIEPRDKKPLIFDEVIIAFGNVSYFYRNINGEKIDKITKLKDWKVKR